MRKYCKVDRENGTKKCPDCDEVKPVEAFPHRKDGSIYAYCKPCNSRRAGEWAVKNRERKNEGERRRRLANPEKFIEQNRRGHYRRRYGIEYAAVLEILGKQSFRCAICETGICADRLYVDHDHSTGAIRGLLCNRCNIGLASIERPGYLDAALAYLESHRSRS